MILSQRCEKIWKMVDKDYKPIDLTKVSNKFGKTWIY